MATESAAAFLARQEEIAKQKALLEFSAEIIEERINEQRIAVKRPSKRCRVEISSDAAGILQSLLQYY
jgi:hypothetical protein